MNCKDSPPLRIKERLSHSSAPSAANPSNRVSSGGGGVSSSSRDYQQTLSKTGSNVSSASINSSAADAAPAIGGASNGAVLTSSAHNSSSTHLPLVPTASCGNAARPTKKPNEENNETSTAAAGADNRAVVAAPAECQPQTAGTETVAVPKRSHQVRRFHRLFRSVPINEDLLKRYSCAFVSDLGLLLQGHLYVSYDWICFHSNIFGIEKIIEIPVHSIATISKSRTAKIIPNAVCVRTLSGKQYAFGSLLSRDSTHQLLSSVLERTQQSLVDTAIASVEPDSASKPLIAEINRPVVESAMLRVPQANVSSIDVGIIQPGTGLMDDNGSSTSGATTDDVEESSDDLSGDNNNEDDYEQLGVGGISGKSTTTKPNSGNSAPGLNVRLRKQGGGNRRLRRQGGAGNDPSYGADPLKMCSGNLGILSCIKGVYKFCLQAFFTWFLNLPKILMVLVVCVILLGFLFLSATVLTVRLIYLQNPHSTFLDYVTTEKNARRPAWTLESLERMNTVVESSLNLIEDVKKQLEILKNEMHKETMSSRSSSQTNGENYR